MADAANTEADRGRDEVRAALALVRRVLDPAPGLFGLLAGAAKAPDGTEALGDLIRPADGAELLAVLLRPKSGAARGAPAKRTGALSPAAPPPYMARRPMAPSGRSASPASGLPTAATSPSATRAVPGPAATREPVSSNQPYVQPYAQQYRRSGNAAPSDPSEDATGLARIAQIRLARRRMTGKLHDPAPGSPAQAPAAGSVRPATPDLATPTPRAALTSLADIARARAAIRAAERPAPGNGASGPIARITPASARPQSPEAIRPAGASVRDDLHSAAPEAPTIAILATPQGATARRIVIDPLDVDVVQPPDTTAPPVAAPSLKLHADPLAESAWRHGVDAP